MSAPKRALEPVAELGAYPPSLSLSERDLLDRDLRVGFACSGGGIRSATFALGLSQGLAKAKLLRHVDVLSTVSGGGYFGSFLGHLLLRARPNEGPDRDRADDLLGQDPPHASVEYLRANGRYLAPNGAGDLFAAAATVLRNWGSALIVVGCVVLLAATLLALVQYGLLERIDAFADLAYALPFWLSPWLMVAAGVVLAGMVPLAWAYWLIRDGSPGDTATHTVARWLGLVAAVAVAAGVSWWAPMAPDPWSDYAPIITLIAQGTIAIGAATLFWHLVVARSEPSPHIARRRRSTALARALWVLVILGVVVVLDSTGLAVITLVGSKSTIGAGLAALVAWIARSPLVTLVGRLKDRSLGPVSASVAVGAALVIVLGYFGGIAALPHLTWRAYGGGLAGLTALLVLAGVLTVVVFATSDLWYFLNRSSMHALYEARLRRAYLGASNPARTGEGTTRLPITEPHPDDGLKRHEYDPTRAGGPIHLINVCVNETVDGQSQLQQRDRKGMGMAIGPAGISVGVRHHALWVPDDGGLPDEDTITSEIRRDLAQQVLGRTVERSAAGFRVFPIGSFKPEDLEVGAWVAISGGAVSTGLGSRTNAALSLLIGLFNIRLGYWWNSGVNVAKRSGLTARTRMQQSLSFLRSFLRMQMALLDEWFARFPGTARPDWYLTDGGHFENLGGYELIRRQLRLIVISDAEADLDHTFAGLSNLVRKARTDFGAEIDFLDDDQMTALRQQVPGIPECVGSLESLRRGRRESDGARKPGTPHERLIVVPSASGLSLAHAALARVTYRDGSKGLIIYVKPTLDGDEPTDVLEYHDAHEAFPHESTGDQFFDEAQWESYRRLGEHIASQVFGGASTLAAQVAGTTPLEPMTTPWKAHDQHETAT